MLVVGGGLTCAGLSLGIVLKNGRGERGRVKGDKWIVREKRVNKEKQRKGKKRRKRFQIERRREIKIEKRENESEEILKGER